MTLDKAAEQRGSTMLNYLGKADGYESIHGKHATGWTFLEPTCHSQSYLDGTLRQAARVLLDSHRKPVDAKESLDK